MARMRTIKPEAFQSEAVAPLSFRGRWTWVGLWTHCDDEGRCKDDARLIKAALYPLEDAVSHVDVEADLVELEASGRLCRYVAENGSRYLHVINFDEHQRPNRRYESKIPACPRDRHGPNPGHALPTHCPRTADAQPVVVVGGCSCSSSKEEVEGDSYAAGGKPPAGTLALVGTTGETATQRSKQITDAYAQAQPMLRWPAINGVVLKAIKANRWTDDEIQAALLRLAHEGRTVTVESLRIELDGIPPPQQRLPSTGDQRTAVGLAFAEKYRAEGR